MTSAYSNEIEAIPKPPETISIPTIDISGETERHSVVAQGTTEIYQGHPCTVSLPQHGRHRGQVEGRDGAFHGKEDGPNGHEDQRRAETGKAIDDPGNKAGCQKPSKPWHRQGLDKALRHSSRRAGVPRPRAWTSRA